MFWRLVDRVQPWGWHIVLHFDAKDIPDYTRLLERMPCPYVIDHMGRAPSPAGIDQEPFQRLLMLMTDERCWMKISGAERLTADGRPPYEDVVPFARALIAAAPDRVLWGTDWPHPNLKKEAPDDGVLVDRIPHIATTPALQQALLIVLVVPYLFLGLALVHVVVRRWSRPGLALGAIYGAMILFGWPILLVLLLGFVEDWAHLRRRWL